MLGMKQLMSGYYSIYNLYICFLILLKPLLWHDFSCYSFSCFILILATLTFISGRWHLQMFLLCFHKNSFKLSPEETIWMKCKALFPSRWENFFFYFNLSHTDFRFWQKTPSNVFFYVSIKTEFAISFKLSPEETIWMKCQSLFPSRSEKIFFISILATLTFSSGRRHLQMFLLCFQ